MPCFHPLTAWRGYDQATGKNCITFKIQNAYDKQPITLPCGRCVGCRLERSRAWAVRCQHEASLHEKNVFITLTYNNENLPAGGSLKKKDFQDFMGRLRKKWGRGIKYYYCGEYGEKFQRPHYHACIFNWDPGDKTIWKIRRGHQTWRSKELERLWDKGHSEIGEVNFETAAYCARYIMKKRTGTKPFKQEDGTFKTAAEHYDGRLPEYNDMSQGVAFEWYKKNWKDVYPGDHLIIKRKGKYVRTKPPKYYDKQFEIDNPEEYKKLKRKRRARANNKTQETMKRQQKLEEIQKRKIIKLKREYENGI